jgi:uncharacterized protein
LPGGHRLKHEAFLPGEGCGVLLGCEKKDGLNIVPTMKVQGIWRYPVKSMGGELLRTAALGPLGIEGDRVVHVQDARGHFATARKYPRLLGFQATLDSSGEPLVNTIPWTDPAVLRQVVDIVGPGARLIHDTSERRFDVLPLLVATDGAIKEFVHDARRLRANIIIGGVEGMEERSWPGRYLRIRDVLIGIDSLRTRCMMTTFDPDTQKQKVGVLKEIVQKFSGQLALNCYIIRGGEIHFNNDVQLLDNKD